LIYAPKSLPSFDLWTATLKALKATEVKKIFATILFMTLTAACVLGQQSKGEDQQRARVRDSGSNTNAGVNGEKTNTGTGRGIDFGKGRTPEVPPVPNPYRFTARRDALVKAVETVMHDRKIVMDTAASKPDEGILISQPFTFIKGAVVAESELSRYADLPSANARGWTRGRYTIIVEVQPIDGVSANVSVNAKIEGRTDGASGAEWTTLRSNGTAEEEFMSALVENITGAPPPGHPTPQP
jgi:hypothetical protein